MTDTTCPECGDTMDAGMEDCPTCGYPESARSAPPLPELERRTVAVQGVETRDSSDGNLI